MSFRIFFSLSMIILMTVLLTIPQAGHAQRMNHPNYNGGGRPSAPPQNYNRSAPAVEPSASGGCQSSATTDARPSRRTTTAGRKSSDD